VTPTPSESGVDVLGRRVLSKRSALDTNGVEGTEDAVSTTDSLISRQIG